MDDLTQPIDPALIQTLETDIIPRLINDICNQPAAAAQPAAPHLHRFTLIFDREGYSPDLFARLNIQHIAILTYHKNPGPDWGKSEFTPHQVTLQNGDIVTLPLAERGTQLSKSLWVRKIRRLDKKGHQTSILSTDFLSDIAPAAMFTRWHQENFFKYMRQHYGLDRLVEHGCQPASRYHPPRQPRLARHLSRPHPRPRPKHPRRRPSRTPPRRNPNHHPTTNPARNPQNPTPPITSR